MSDERNIYAPRLEPEVVQAEADKKWRGDTEKVATTATKGHVAGNGVKLLSRYGKADEINLMGWIVEDMGWAAALIESVFCDSKACSHFTVTAKGRPRQSELHDICMAFEMVCMRLNGGHNGIVVEDARGHKLAECNPDWIADA